MAARFILNETSYHGSGAIKEIATETKMRGFKKAFVCSDADLIKFGVTKKVLDVLKTFEKENGKSVEIQEYCLYVLGEGLEKKEDNFAEEVASMQK